MSDSKEEDAITVMITGFGVSYDVFLFQPSFAWSMHGKEMAGVAA